MTCEDYGIKPSAFFNTLSYLLPPLCAIALSPFPLGWELLSSLDSSDPGLWNGVRLPRRELSSTGKSLSWGADSLHLFVFSQKICCTFLVEICLLITALVWALCLQDNWLFRSSGSLLSGTPVTFSCLKLFCR